MKRTKHRRNLTVYTYRGPAYPNAADSNYLAQRALNILTGIVSGMGFISAMVFLVAIS